jgi:D-inositol-3-phosphate glycosyltransferase
MLSVHTSPLDQPGTGDAGGMNVYIAQTARRLARRGVAVEVFTRAASPDHAPRVELAPGVLVHNVQAGPYDRTLPVDGLPRGGLLKDDLPGRLCAITSAVLRRAACHDSAGYDLIHSHYWLSGQVGWLARQRWGVPLVHTMHTMGRVKNLDLAPGEHPEPVVRTLGEQQVVDVADRLVANTEHERADLISLYDADPGLVDVVLPGVDLDVFRPGDRAADRASLGYGPDDLVALFVGRIQPLKAPDLLIRAAAELRARDPRLSRRLRVVICGGPSGSATEHPGALADLATRLGVDVELVAPEPPGPLRRRYAAADVLVVPSHSESFGLAALEAQACGTPVLAARVGGLPIAVADGESGLLVDGHDPTDWALALERVLGDDRLRGHLADAARGHARTLSWDASVDQLLVSYGRAMAGPRERLSRAG